MFTGLVEEVGEIQEARSIGGGRRFKIKASEILSDISIDDSICLNGCCLTAVEFDKNSFSADAIEETLRKTNLGEFRPGKKVNLERALLPNKRLGGHFMQGHIDSTGKIISIIKESTGTLVKISFDVNYRKYLINVGSIAVNGCSLTIAKIESTTFTVAVIPHTWENTVFKFAQSGDTVNLEFDMIGKYIENLHKYK